jgi:hypothetical protein
MMESTSKNASCFLSQPGLKQSQTGVEIYPFGNRLARASKLIQLIK